MSLSTRITLVLDKREACAINFLERRRSKRREHNIIIEDVDDDKTPLWMLKDHADSMEPLHVLSPRTRRPSQKSSESIEAGSSTPQHNVNNRDSIHNVQKKGDTEAEEDFVLYAIRDPELWHSVQIQLYKKYNDADGKVLWDDVTKGMKAK